MNNSIYVSKLETDDDNFLNANKLLAILIYKNVYPKDFESLHRSEGNFTQILNHQEELIRSGELVYRAEITELEEEIQTAKEVVKSPIVGTAYLAPEPGAKPFVSVGKNIKKGDTVMIVEAMKTMNHVPSTLDGIVKKVSVEDGQPVEFGQVLIVLE